MNEWMDESRDEVTLLQTKEKQRWPENQQKPGERPGTESSS
jgi:hypothetical protein